MRNRVTASEAAAIGERLRKARLRENRGLVEAGSKAGVHHSQVSRCERGDFKIVSPNVQKLCKELNVKHPKVPRDSVSREDLRSRFDTLLVEVPGSAPAFERLFDMLEHSRARRAGRRRRP